MTKNDNKNKAKKHARISEIYSLTVYFCIFIFSY